MLRTKQRGRGTAERHSSGKDTQQDENRRINRGHLRRDPRARRAGPGGEGHLRRHDHEHDRQIALDVKISKAGFVKKVTEIRVKDVPSNCDVSGPVPAVEHTFPATLRVDQQTARYGGTYTQPDYGNQSRIDGKIKRRKTKGTIQINYHYPAQGQFPEENCDTGVLAYKASLDNVDETVTRPSVRLRH
jgi:hypothetical protein